MKTRSWSLLLIPFPVVILGCSTGGSGSALEPTPVESEAPPYPPPPELMAPNTMEYLERAPTYTPYTVRPDILNRREVAETLEREYPKGLRDEGIGGTTQLWFFVDAEGVIRKIQINKSSGHAGLDHAAIRVGRRIRFSPATNEGDLVPVWISLPITFTTR